jgi:hypothetical protein
VKLSKNNVEINLPKILDALEYFVSINNDYDYIRFTPDLTKVYIFFKNKFTKSLHKVTTIISVVLLSLHGV